MTLPAHDVAAEPFDAAKAVLDEIANDGGAVTEGDFSALAMLLVDATLRGDEQSLKSVQEWLRWEYGEGVLATGNLDEEAVRYGRLLGLTDVSHWAIERVLPVASLSRLERGAYATRFLRELVASPGLSNQELADLLAVDQTEISRVGRRLLEDGMAVRRRLGRRNCWEISPKGRRSLQLLDGARTDNMQVTSEVVAVDDLIQSVDRLTEGNSEPYVDSAMKSVVRAVGGAFIELLDHGPVNVDALSVQAATVADVDEDDAKGAVARLLRSNFATRVPNTNNIELNGQRASAIGVTITAEHVLGVLVGPRGNPLGDPHRCQLQATDVPSVVAAVTRVTREALAARDDPGDEILGIGVALAGHVDGGSGNVVFSTELRANDQLWRDVPLAHLLEDRCHLPVVIENDANALTVHEQLYGNGTDVADFVAILVSDGGLGCGIVSEGIPLHGHQGLAGEVGHLFIDPGGEACRCGKRGCLETVVSLQGIRRAYARHAGVNPDDVPSLLRAGEDELLADVLAAAGAALGKGVSTLLNVVNPARVVVFVPPALVENSNAEEIFKRAVLSTATQYSFSAAARGFDLIVRAADDNLGAVGAASLVLSKLVGRHNVVKGTSRPLTLLRTELDSDRVAMLENAFA